MLERRVEAMTGGRRDRGILIRVRKNGHEDGIENFGSIRAAVLRAEAGSVIQVAAGTYSEELVIGMLTYADVC
jgi:hypothetical protein